MDVEGRKRRRPAESSRVESSRRRTGQWLLPSSPGLKVPGLAGVGTVPRSGLGWAGLGLGRGEWQAQTGCRQRRVQWRWRRLHCGHAHTINLSKAPAAGNLEDAGKQVPRGSRKRRSLPARLGRWQLRSCAGQAREAESRDLVDDVGIGKEGELNLRSTTRRRGVE
ncbi:hypothetical protein CKAH01_09372 [Colletotrichum kahawae]|uniref:Uncharacterized protein n=1 Tax=Colletotrichum kahawae TaxID=34407 RepID=A0AAE0D0E9_COLKA|nr:hypothetical protein CKAH01_09372 [Colletotrichum kahawae]